MTFYFLDNKTKTTWGELVPASTLWLRCRLVLRFTLRLWLRGGNCGAAASLIERSLEELEVENFPHDLGHLAPPRLYQGVQYRPDIVTIFIIIIINILYISTFIL